MNTQQHAERGGDAFPAFETQKHAEQMTEKSCEASQRRDARLETKLISGPNHEPALETVSEQCDDGRSLVATAQHIGCAGIARAVGARILQTKQAARYHCKGDGADKIGGDRKSTRLNSSHVRISYAVFCLKK